MSHNRTIDSPRKIDLADFDPDDTGGLKHKDAPAQLAQLEERLGQQQDLLYGAAHQSVLVVLQGMDTSGKDGTVKHVMTTINPIGCHVWDFKAPTPDELAHDFLWRIHQRTPSRGMLAIFNRSHYEDVLVARVHKLVPHETWQARYEQINHFERMLTQNGTIIIKFFLHISQDEQRKRLLAREDDPDKAWKLSVADWQERAYWNEYQIAYADAIGNCGTEWAPWHIVPANKKWYRNHFIANAIVTTLEPHERKWRADLAERGKTELKALQESHVRER